MPKGGISEHQNLEKRSLNGNWFDQRGGVEKRNNKNHTTPIDH